MGRTLLSYYLLSPVHLGVPTDIRDGWDHLNLLYREEPVDEISVARIGIENSGRIPITSGDFEAPIRLTFGETVRVLDSRFIRASPSHIEPIASAEQNVIEIQPILLNSGDGFILEVLLVGDPALQGVHSRLVGVPKIGRLHNSGRTDLYLTHVRNEGYVDTTLNRRLLKINATLGLPAGLFMLILALSGAHTSRVIPELTDRLLVLNLSALCYLTGSTLLLALPMPSWLIAKLLLLFIGAGFLFFVGWSVPTYRGLFRRISHKLT